MILANNQRTEEAVRAKYDLLPAAVLPSSFSYVISLLLYSVFFHPRLYWIPQRMPRLQLGETIFTLNYEVKRMNPQILRLGGRLFPGFGKIRNKRKELARNYRNILEPMRPDIVFLNDTDDEGIALLRFPIMFKTREKRDRIMSELKKRGLGATGSYPVPLNALPGAANYFDRKEESGSGKTGQVHKWGNCSRMTFWRNDK